MQLSLLDQWDSHNLPLLQRSRLYNRPPLGQGSYLQESLVSYVVRLANAHSVSPNILINREVIPLTDISFEKSIGSFYLSYAKTINSYTKYARGFSSALGQLTGRTDLSECTFIPWGDVFDPNGAGMLYNHPRWCPGCLHDWRAKGEESYFPLYWYLSPVKFCSEHNNELVDKCLSCGRHQPFIPKHYHIDHCSYCGSWLGQKDAVAVQKPTFSPTRFDRFAADAVAEMIREGSDALAYASYTRLQQRLKEYAELLADGVCSKFERLVGFRHSVLSNWITRDTRPKIQLLFLFCFRLETTPVRLLREDIPATIPQIIRPFPIHIARIQVKFTAKLRKQLHNDLQAIIDSTDEPITFMEACKKLGYTNNFLKYWFPDECRRITDQRKKYVIEKRDEMARQAEEFAYNTVMELLSQGIRVNKKILERFLLPHKLSLARPAVRAGVKRAKEAFFAGNSAND